MLHGMAAKAEQEEHCRWIILHLFVFSESYAVKHTHPLHHHRSLTEMLRKLAFEFY